MTSLIQKKKVRIHHAILNEIACLDSKTAEEFQRYCEALVQGDSLGMPQSRPIPIVAHGVHELRMKDRFGQLRFFYYVKLVEEILVFHVFRKKTQETPDYEVKLGRKRLRAML